MGCRKVGGNVMGVSRTSRTRTIRLAQRGAGAGARAREVARAEAEGEVKAGVEVEIEVEGRGDLPSGPRALAGAHTHINGDAIVGRQRHLAKGAYLSTPWGDVGQVFHMVCDKIQ